MRILLIFLLLLPQLSAAGVYMCVDPQTGKKSFTDRACDDDANREELRIGAANTTSGAKTSGTAGNKTWNSDRDETRDGRQYRQEERVRTGSASTTPRSGYLGTNY